MQIYLDYNATCPLRAEAKQAWLTVIDRLAGNPSSLHVGGRWARDQIDLARERIAAALGVREDEIVFTSGGTESNNTALIGTARALGSGARLITDGAQHSSVLEVLDLWESMGGTTGLLEVDTEALPRLDSLEALLTSNLPTVVSLTAANNEIGAVPDLEHARLVLDRASSGPLLLHVDAVQALGKLDLPSILPYADLASFSAHKVGGPNGVGVLWRRSGTAVSPLLVGGGQEAGFRPGTENTAGIVAASIAIELAVAERVQTATKTRAIADLIVEDLGRELPRVRVLGPADPQRRLPNTLCLLAPGLDGKVLVTRLDLAGLSVGAGSACSSGSVGASHVLLAMGFQEDEARAGIRLSLGRDTTPAEGKHAVAILCKLLGPSHAT